MEQWIQWFSDAVNEKSITDASGLKSDVAYDRGTYVNGDAYDPRKPEYIAAASQEEVEASEAKLVALQRYKLEATMQRRRASIAPQVVEHYERVLDNMSQTTRSCARSEFAQAGGSHASRACGRPRSDPIAAYASTKADDTEVDIVGEVVKPSTGLTGDLTVAANSRLDDTVSTDASTECTVLSEDEDVVQGRFPVFGRAPVPATELKEQQECCADGKFPVRIPLEDGVFTSGPRTLQHGGNQTNENRWAFKAKSKR